MSARAFEDRPALRAFEATDAARATVPVWFGLFGASGSGKTDSALRIATGIQRIVGGELFVIDTEGRRALHYAPEVPGRREPGTFLFKHIDMRPPFSALDYLGAVEHAVSKGARVIVIDSMTHEHEGEGGFLAAHAAESERLAAKWSLPMEKAQWTAWQDPKKKRRQVIERFKQLGVHFVFCFRAADKTKPPPKGKRDAVHLGDQPVGGKDWIFEMTLCALLRPGAKGVPTWVGDEPAENMMIKAVRYLDVITKRPGALDETTGELLGRWARGEGMADEPREDERSPFERLRGAMAQAPSVDAINSIGREAVALLRAQKLSKAEDDQLRGIADERRRALRAAAENQDAEVMQQAAQEGGGS